jgi:hypothetical protein
MTIFQIELKIMPKEKEGSNDLSPPFKEKEKEGYEEFLHTFTIKICIHKKPGWKWNYYVVVV